MWCIHNAIELEKRGVATAAICSSNFESLVETTAEAKGFPNFARVTIPHPIAEKDAGVIRKKADDAIEDLIRVLTPSSEKSSGETGEKSGTERGGS